MTMDNSDSPGKPCTYILRCRDGSLYTGWTNDIETRLAAHNAGKGGKYTRGRTPVSLVHVEYFDTKEEAMSREYAIKQLSRAKKEALISSCQSCQNEQKKAFERYNFIDLDSILSKIIEEARAICIPVPQNINPQVKVNSRPKRRLGCCHNDGKIFVIEISRYVLDAAYDAADCYTRNAAVSRIHNTLAHEVIHTCRECFDHGPLWRTYAGMMNKTYGYSITRTYERSDDDSCATEEEPSYNYVIRCTSCGKEYPRQKFTCVMKKINAYRCNCGGRLEWYKL